MTEAVELPSGWRFIRCVPNGRGYSAEAIQTDVPEPQRLLEWGETPDAAIDNLRRWVESFESTS